MVPVQGIESEPFSTTNLALSQIENSQNYMVSGLGSNGRITAASSRLFDFTRPGLGETASLLYRRFRPSREDGPTQVSRLVYWMGDRAEDILVAFGLGKNEKKMYNNVLVKFDNHFVKKRNVI